MKVTARKIGKKGVVEKETPGKREYPPSLFGVFDGHGGPFCSKVFCLFFFLFSFLFSFLK